MTQRALKFTSRFASFVSVTSFVGLTSLTACFMLGCEKDAATPAALPPGIDLASMDTSTSPCADFYQYACGGWVASHPVGGTATYRARFEDPLATALPRLRRIVEGDAAGVHSLDDPHATLVGNYYASCIVAPNDTSSRVRVQTLMARLDEASSLDDIAELVASQRKVGSGSFFTFSVAPDPGGSGLYLASIDQVGGELGDRSYYLDEDQAELRARYRSHIERMTQLMGSTAIDASAAIAIETKIATASRSADQRRDPESLYHPMKLTDMVALAPSFPWKTFLAGAGSMDLDTVNVVDPAYLEALEQIFTTTSIDDLKSYMRWQLLQDLSPRLDQPFLDEDFDFQSNFTGADEPPPRWFTCLDATLRVFGAAVSQPYAAQFSDDEASKTTAAMFEQTRAAFAKRLASSAWIDPATRAEAQHKLDAMLPKIGAPSKGPEYPGLSMDPISYIDNVNAFVAFRQSERRQMLGTPIDRSAWSLTAITNNAVYNWSLNDVTLPMEFLVSPNLSPHRSAAANFGALGAVLGHEMTHGFDDVGRHYDSKGTLRDWWTPTVEARFVERSQCIVDQFDAYEPLPGEHVDGRLTLGENIADLGGLHLAYTALFDGTTDPALVTGGDGLTPQQVFFVSYAQMWCENMSADEQRAMLLTEPHAPGRYRVNGPLSNVREFGEAFSCPAESAMVRHDVCELW